MQPGSLSDGKLRSLAREISVGSVGSETDWLEWKSALDLTTAAARFEVARQILGMASGVIELPLSERSILLDDIEHDLPALDQV